MAYDEMEKGEYVFALKSFEEYKEKHSNIYWVLHEVVNESGSELGLQKIEEAIIKCKSK